MEFMASLQGGLDEHKPSLFELLSEQQLASLLPPSLRYLLAVATHRYPRYLLRALNSFDELYALLSLLIERHFLLTYSGGFTENFYGLKRERVLATKSGEVPRAQIAAADTVRETLKLRNRDVWANLAVMVGLPYLKRKLDEGYDIHAAHQGVLGGFGRDRMPDNANVRQRLLYYYKWFLRKVYPSVNAAYCFSLLAFNLAYLFDTSKFHSPFLWLIGTRMRRMGAVDYRAIEAATQQKSPGRAARPGEGGSLFNPRIMVSTVGPRLLSSLRILLPTSIFALKFLEWWHASDFARQLSKKAAEGLELPPPIISGLPRKNTVALGGKAEKQAQASENEKFTDAPSSTSLEKKDDSRKPPISSTTGLPIFTVPASESLCPICTSPIINPTAAQTGFVFCYTCIHKWVAGEHERQTAFMEGGGGEEGWGDEEGDRGKRWESGKGRCAVTGRRLLGGVDGLRRVVV